MSVLENTTKSLARIFDKTATGIIAVNKWIIEIINVSIKHCAIFSLVFVQSSAQYSVVLWGHTSHAANPSSL